MSYTAEVGEAEERDGVVWFAVHVTRHAAHRPEERWQLSRRYSQFDALRRTLEQAGAQVRSFPPKRWLFSNSREVVAQRQTELTGFLREVVVPLAGHPAVEEFLQLQRGHKAPTPPRITLPVSPMGGSMDPTTPGGWLRTAVAGSPPELRPVAHSESGGPSEAP